MSITLRPCRSGYAPLGPHVAISIDPGTRNLGYAFVGFESIINFNTLTVDTNYTVIDFGAIDLLKKADGTEGEGDLSHLDEMIKYHFGPSATTEFITTLKRLQAMNKYEFSLHIENQKGIGQDDRSTNPYLADELMDPHYVCGGIIPWLSAFHGIARVYHSGKTSKWGNTSCPHFPAKQGGAESKFEKKKRQARNKVMRKSFFIFFVMNLLERQRNLVGLNKLNQYDMDDKAHRCDAITQGMRGLLLILWLKLEEMCGPKPMTVNVLPDDVKNIVLAKLNLVSWDNISGYVPKAKKEPRKKKGPAPDGAVSKRRKKKNQ